MISGGKTAIASLIGKTHMNLKKILVRGVLKSRFFRSARCKTYAQNQNLQKSAYLYGCWSIFAPLCDTFCPQKPYRKHAENEARKKLRKRGVPGVTGGYRLSTVSGSGGPPGGGLRGRGFNQGIQNTVRPSRGRGGYVYTTLRDTAAHLKLSFVLRAAFI